MPTGLDDGPCQIDSKENKSQQYHLIEKEERGVSLIRILYREEDKKSDAHFSIFLFYKGTLYKLETKKGGGDQTLICKQ